MRVALMCLILASGTATAAEPLGVAVGKGGDIVDRVALHITPARDGARIACSPRWSFPPTPRRPR